ncbi:hypothetical protein BT96DRAFT_951482 [Gymnopus androsaceus JB14]|uniref:Uncharacterized protein n=1 Tax=Gymnopus androsaceus JB14 TaxID=1447944 RepID=A0A6A4GCQ1_9AGAR|nr:hypothetical protein BT96DRAFT_951482 [Gymnopus androsaceus JB14]
MPGLALEMVVIEKKKYRDQASLTENLQATGNGVGSGIGIMALFTPVSVSVLRNGYANSAPWYIKRWNWDCFIVGSSSIHYWAIYLDFVTADLSDNTELIAEGRDLAFCMGPCFLQRTP